MENLGSPSAKLLDRRNRTNGDADFRRVEKKRKRTFLSVAVCRIAWTRRLEPGGKGKLVAREIHLVESFRQHIVRLDNPGIGAESRSEVGYQNAQVTISLIHGRQSDSCNSGLFRRNCSFIVGQRSPALD